jgi:hypothetical protein
MRVLAEGANDFSGSTNDIFRLGGPTEATEQGMEHFENGTYLAWFVLHNRTWNFRDRPKCGVAVTRRAATLGTCR